MLKFLEKQRLKQRLKIKEYKARFSGPTRMVVGCMHGKEYEVTWDMLYDFEPRVSNGSFVIVPTVDKGERYVSTLDPAYQKTKAYKEYCKLMKIFEPELCVELHTYERLESLVSERRKRSAPPLVAFNPKSRVEDQVLHGGPPPFVKHKFKEHGSYITLEVNPNFGMEAKSIVHYVLQVVAESTKPSKVREKLFEKFPESMRKAEKIFSEYMNQ